MFFIFFILLSFNICSIDLTSRLFELGTDNNDNKNKQKIKQKKGFA